ncbi:hypothetical protein SADUNF_Sadunf17G0106600 [Salix dunnii]|uniref:Uncharacterized protein n=1 Tax=Salix dunnii TaxID=1413687 RepID=A0A835J3M1_9ROSI|nr:hypothetical protein SADUNF_Sadunf17G0106600 [Salix dunnii]
MAIGRDSKDLISPLLAVNLVIQLINISTGGNPATSFMLIYALTGGVIGPSSMLVGFVHLPAWRNDSLAGASAMAIISLAITALAFGYLSGAILVVVLLIPFGNKGHSLSTGHSEREHSCLVLGDNNSKKPENLHTQTVESRPAAAKGAARDATSSKETFYAVPERTDTGGHREIGRDSAAAASENIYESFSANKIDFGCFFPP